MFAYHYLHLSQFICISITFAISLWILFNCNTSLHRNAILTVTIYFYFALYWHICLLILTLIYNNLCVFLFTFAIFPWIFFNFSTSLHRNALLAVIIYLYFDLYLEYLLAYSDFHLLQFLCVFINICNISLNIFQF